MTSKAKLGWAAAALALVGLVALLVIRAQALPEGVKPIVWDKEVCAECAMAVSDPRFAAQLQREDGVVLNFDDPGCLFLYLDDHDPEIHALYFHRVEGDEWLDGDHVGFVPESHSPMGYGLGAAPKEAPGAISMDEAAKQVRARYEGGERQGEEEASRAEERHE